MLLNGVNNIYSLHRIRISRACHPICIRWRGVPVADRLNIMSPPSLLLTLNAGSSSLKFGVYEPDPALNPVASGQVVRIGGNSVLTVTPNQAECSLVPVNQALGPVSHSGAVDAMLNWLGRFLAGRPVMAVSHRVVHGGPALAEPIRLDAAAMDRLADWIPLAPLHQPFNLAGIRAAREAFPDAVQVACFDTAFHRHHDFVTDAFALPRQLYDAGIRRYGFHGLSYEFIARRLQVHHPVLHGGRVVVAHLGNGASMCALRSGRSMASTMGFSALDGLPMGTRCGQLDPGVLLYLMEHERMDAHALRDLLYHESGLKGLSGLSHDVRELTASDSPRAREALAYFANRCRREIGALAACLEGIDGLVFTGGIGEHSAEVRAMILSGMNWLGIEWDPQSNIQHETVISSPESRVRVLVIPTDEERMLAEHACQLLGLRVS